MARIGEFEVAAREADPTTEPDTFLFCGEEFTVAPDLNLVALGRFMKAANTGVDSEDPEALPLMIDTVGSCVIEEDEKRFLDLASKRRAQPPVLLQIIQTVMEVQSGRPTVLPDDSSGGSSTTSASSRELLSFEGSSPRLNWRDTPFGRRELAAHPELYEGIGSVAEHGRSLSAVGS
jgi:hypothetical protein